MRVAIVTESFLPTLNGVTTSVCRVVECLRADGHEVLVVAPRPTPTSYAGMPVQGVASVPVRDFPVGLPAPELTALLRRFRPDVVHAASPFVLGARGLAAARDLRVPSVAVYQTDMAAYLGQHAPGAVGRGASRAAWQWLRRVHALADLTLAPSSSALDDLHRNGIARTALWGRGVDTAQFHPGWRRDAGTMALRRGLAPNGETLVGYVGRLAPEKELHRLAELVALPDTRLVLVGDGPDRSHLAATLAGAAAAHRAGQDGRAGQRLPAAFLGQREGDDLARAYAALDVFVHTGTRETFGQTLQEAAATGLPVVAPARGGPLDLVAHGRTGWLFDPDATGALSACIGHLVGNPQDRAAMGHAGFEQVAGRSWAGLTRELTGHYRAAIAARAALAA